jgi:peptide chain release factor subunit 1
MPETDPPPHRAAELGSLSQVNESARALASRAVAVMERPLSINPADVAACAEALHAEGSSGERYDGLLGLLAAIAYWRPDLLGPGLVGLLERRFGDHAMADGVYRGLAELQRLLIATPAGPDAVRSVQALLARPDLESAAYDALLDVLSYAASWATPHLDLPALLAIAENERLEGHRLIRLLNRAIEPAIFACPEDLSARLLERLIGTFGDHRPLKYPLSYLAGRANASSEVRALASSAIEGQFPLHGLIAEKLGRDRVAVLVVQNIADRQGDEIIRLVPLLESLLSYNPLLEIVLITHRQYLYGHSRLTVVPIDDATSVAAVLRDRFDGVIDFYESGVVEVNHSQWLEEQIRASVRSRPPFLYVTSRKGWNHFVYERVDVQGRAYADVLGLDRQRLANVYESTFRLIAELGLPLRLGEEPPGADSVIAGLPCQEAEAAWATLTEQNAAGRPVALICPFGGGEPLKGYVERQVDALAERIRRFIQEGFYVVLLPNGLPWGSAGHAHDVRSRLAQSEQEQVVVGPDPADGVGEVTYRHAGAHTVPYASYQMRLETYFVRFADLIIAVEGWMVHTGYCLGKPLRVLMLPYSHPSDWHPYGRTRQQALVIPAASLVLAEGDLPPLPEQPRKFALLSILRSLGESGDARAEPLLQWALRSDDRDIRLTAASALRGLAGPEIDTTWQTLLADPAHRVRAVAAGALLERLADGTGHGRALQRAQLRAHVLIGEDARNWVDVASLGESARPALTIALRDDDSVLRREAAIVLRALDRRAIAAEAARSSATVGGVAGVRDVWHALTEVLPVGELRHPESVGPLLRRLGRQMPRHGPAADGSGTVLILTPVKDAADCLEGYFRRLRALTYPHHLISVGLLEGDSADTTFRDLRRHASALRGGFRRVRVWKRDFGYQVPPGVPRWAPGIQLERRRVLAMSRNYLLFRALDDEAWVLWVDVDVVEYPPDLIERLLSTGKEVVQPHCVLEYGGPTFDLNGWRDHGRLHLEDLRGDDELVELDAVGGTLLLVLADLHRAGLVYPPFLYGTANPRVRTGTRQYFEGTIAGEIETEGLGIMAGDMGYRCWGMPRFEVIHRRK